MNVYARIRKIEDNLLFKRLFDTLMTAELGIDFESVKEWRDFGVDGYSNQSGIVFQLYCPRYPERTALKNYKEKATKDMTTLQEAITNNNWTKPVKRWIFVTPDDLPSEVINHIQVEVARILKITDSSTLTAFNLAPLFLKHSTVQVDFPEIASGIYFDKTPRLQVNFLDNRTYKMIEVFNNGTEDVQDFKIEYDKGVSEWTIWNDHALYQSDNPIMGHPHTCFNLQKGERQYFNNVMNAGGFKIRISAVGVESGKTFVSEVDFPIVGES